MSKVLIYDVTSDEDRTITGLGVFKAGETQTFGPDEAVGFLRVMGVPLNQGNVPEGVKVVINLADIGNENKEG